jgi:dTDP-4-dehydrorhamnose reductase
MVARAREQGALQVVADQRLTPTYTADLAEALIQAVERDSNGLLHLSAAGACSWHEFTVEILSLAGIEAPVEATETTIAPGAADRPLNGVLGRQRAEELGLTGLRHWRDALADYMDAAGLLVRSRPVVEGQVGLDLG